MKKLLQDLKDSNLVRKVIAKTDQFYQNHSEILRVESDIENSPSEIRLHLENDIVTVQVQNENISVSYNNETDLIREYTNEIHSLI